MKKFLFGFFNRKTLCYEDFVIFDDFSSLVDYVKALYTLRVSGKYPEFEFTNYILYPEDYTLLLLGELRLDSVQPADTCSLVYKSYGDFDDVLGIKKVSDDNVERETDICDSEPVYSSSSPRS